MTDPITCPECQGRRGTRFSGGLFLQCHFCQGRGWVGGQHEPAERGDHPPPIRPPAWQHPALQDTELCGYCLGAGEIIQLGGGEERATSLGAAPCPRGCKKPEQTQ